MVRVMTYGGSIYLVYMSACFLLLKVLSSDPTKAINPGYWSPPSLFNLNSRSGGLGIEDILFMFFVGAIAAGFYEIVFNAHMSKKPIKRFHKGHALLIGVLVGAFAYAFTPVSAIYFTVVVQFVAAFAIIIQREDLLKNSLTGATLFMLLYVACFSIFNFMFPDFLGRYYNLEHTSHIWLLRLPLEEYLYSFSLGMVWAPIYEYEHRFKDSKRQSLRLRRASLAAAASRR